MAHRPSKRRKSQPESSVASFLWGFALLACAVLVALALVSYSPEDWPASDNYRPVHNWIGFSGALIAHTIGPMFLGRWAAFGLAALIAVWAWMLIRRISWQKTFQISAWIMVFSLWLSAVLGLAGTVLPGLTQSETFPHSGWFGFWAANEMTMALGRAGALIVMVVVLIIIFSLSVAGFAGGLTRSVNAAADRVAEFKPKARPNRKRLLRIPSFTLFGKKTPGEPDYEIPDLPDQRAEEQEKALTSGNGRQKTALHDLSSPSGRKTAGKQVPGQMAIDVEADTGYVYPTLEMFQLPPPGRDIGMSDEEQTNNARLLEKSLATFGVEARVVRINPGPVITRFDLEPAPGVKVSRIEALADDIALALRARGLRILAPIPGVAAVGVEIANPTPATVTFREVAESPVFQASTSRLTIALGRTVSGEIFISDLGTLPHLLIAGTTGAGKSVCVNTIIASILLRTSPDDVQLVLIDPKKLELSAYNELRRHHVTHRSDLSEYVITRPDEAVKVLRSCMAEMERRYDLLAERGTRHLDEYNEAVRADPSENESPLPYIVVIIDELADLMVTAQREVEEPIARLAQLARAVGIHLVVATQRPSVDVITGVIKANFPARIAFRVAMRVDSRTILDANGAEMLLGQGDMLFQHPEEPAPIRIQGALLTSKEISSLITHICRQPVPRNKLSLPIEPEDTDLSGGPVLDAEDRDPLFLEAAKIVVRTGQGSVSILQRRLKVGYARAARLIDQLERAGIVGPFDGSKARQVLVDEHYFDNRDEA